MGDKKRLSRLFTLRHKPSKLIQSPPVTQPIIPPGDLPAYRPAGKKVRPEELRELRELIRQRYQLDVVIWNMRWYSERDHDVVHEKMKKADALLSKIRRIISSMDSPEYFDTSKKDYEKFGQIRDRIMKGGKRNWKNHPPWEDVEIPEDSIPAWRQPQPEVWR